MHEGRGVQLGFTTDPKKEYVAPKVTMVLVNHEIDLLAGSVNGDVEGFTNGGVAGPEDDFPEGE